MVWREEKADITPLQEGMTGEKKGRRALKGPQCVVWPAAKCQAAVAIAWMNSTGIRSMIVTSTSLQTEDEAIMSNTVRRL